LASSEHGSGDAEQVLRSVTRIDQVLWRRFAEAKTTEDFCAS